MSQVERLDVMRCTAFDPGDGHREAREAPDALSDNRPTSFPVVIDPSPHSLAAMRQRFGPNNRWRELDTHIAWCDERIAAHAKDNADVKKAATLMGIGPVGASTAVGTVGDFKQFGALIGLTPRQHSSGGKNNLGGITRRGDNDLRSLLIQGAQSAVMTAHKRSDPISVWAAASASAPAPTAA